MILEESFVTVPSNIDFNLGEETMNEYLYQYAVLLHPTQSDQKKGVRAEVIVPPSDFMLARNDQEVVMKATREIPSEIMEHADRLEVAVRPF